LTFVLERGGFDKILPRVTIEWASAFETRIAGALAHEGIFARVSH